MSAIISLAVDLGLAALLVATLAHAIRLNRRLGVLRQDRATLEALIKGFNDATVRAEAGVARLRSAAEGAGRQIAERLQSADTVRSDLAFLIERGDQLADRLDSAVRAARGAAMEREAALADATSHAAAAADRGAVRRIEPSLSLSRAADEPRLAETRMPEPVLALAAAGPSGSEEPRLRSQAERDLLRALKLAR
ncbi:MAG: hypothetical protein IT557_03565 [Alphaproteobacteria bacterium]|nr:hypothetical protein [Alphaproteobacteria bacterium]